MATIGVAICLEQQREVASSCHRYNGRYYQSYDETHRSHTHCWDDITNKFKGDDS